MRPTPYLGALFDQTLSLWKKAEWSFHHLPVGSPGLEREIRSCYLLLRNLVRSAGLDPDKLDSKGNPRRLQPVRKRRQHV